MIDPMEYIKEIYLGVVIIILLGLCYIVKEVFFKEKKKDLKYDYYMQKALRYYEKKDIHRALEFFKLCLTMTETKKQLVDTYNLIATSYCRLFNYELAVNYFSKSLGLMINTNLYALDQRGVCYEEMGLYKEAFEDIFLYETLRTTKDNIAANELLEERLSRISSLYSIKKTNEFIRERDLPHSRAKCDIIFRMFPELIPTEDNDVEDVAYLIKHSQYEKLFKRFLGKDAEKEKDKFNEKYRSNMLFTYDIVLSLIYLANEEFKKSIEVLTEPQNELEEILLEYFKLNIQKTENRNWDLLERSYDFVNKDHPSIILWLGKYCRKRGDEANFFKFLDRIKETYSIAYYDILDYYADKDHNLFIKYKNEALERFPKDNSIKILCCEHFYQIHDEVNLRDMIDKIDSCDAKSLFVKGLYNKMVKNTYLQIEYFSQAIELDPTLFKAYFFLGSVYKSMGEDKYLSYVQQALSVASSFDEVYLCFREILIEENSKILERKLKILYRSF